MNSSKSETEATLKALESYGVKAAAFQADLTTEASIEKWFLSHIPLIVWAAADITSDRLFSDAAAALGVSKFDIAINTVGKVLKKPIVETTEQEFDNMFLVNSKCAFFFIKHAARSLNEEGTIISLVTSLLGAFAPDYSTYQGSKAPVEWFTKSAAKEWVNRVSLINSNWQFLNYRLQPKNIRVNCVAPGPMDTPFFYGQETEDAVAYHKSQALTGRLTDIKDIAPLVEFLCKDKWITGQIIFCKSIYWMTRSFVVDILRVPANGGYTTRWWPDKMKKDLRHVLKCFK